MTPCGGCKSSMICSTRSAIEALLKWVEKLIMPLNTYHAKYIKLCE